MPLIVVDLIAGRSAEQAAAAARQASCRTGLAYWAKRVVEKL